MDACPPDLDLDQDLDFNARPRTRVLPVIKIKAIILIMGARVLPILIKTNSFKEYGRWMSRPYLSYP